MRSLLAIVLLGGMSAAAAQRAPSLGAAASFAVLSGTSVVSDGARVGGNVGVSPGSTISGPIAFTVGTTFRNDRAASAAQRDYAEAYGTLAALACKPLPDLRPPPGVYCIGPLLSETLILDGDSAAVWIFQKPEGDFATAPQTNILLLNGASRDNVFWVVPGSATLGAGTTFAGNLLAAGNIDVQRGTRLSGRALSRGGAVTISDAFVSMCCALVALSPRTLPDATVGTPYNQPVTPAGAVVTSGALPPGLSSAVSGTPTTPGEYRFTLTAAKEECVGTREYTISVTGCPVITIEPATLTPLVDGCERRYRQQLTARGGTEPYTFSATMPGGINRTGDTISGTPLECVRFEVTARDQLGCEGKRTYEVCPWPIQIAPAALRDGFVGVPYSEPLMLSGGNRPYALTICQGELPDGLFPVGNKIEGTPRAAVVATFTVHAADAAAASGSRAYELRIRNCALSLTSLPAPLPVGAVGERYDATFRADGGEPPYVFAPRELHGVKLLADGIFTGVPDEEGTFDLPVKATDAAGCSIEPTFKVTFGCGITMTPASPILPDAAQCAPYSQQFGASPGGPFTFASSGSLPAGLPPVSPDGVLAGMPAQSGDFPFTVTATDTSGHCPPVSKNYSLHVTGGGNSAITGASTTLPPGAVAVLYGPLQLPVVGGTPPYRFKVITASDPPSPIGLPPGLVVSPSGVVSGKPTKGGSYRFTVDVTSAGSCVPHRIAYSITVFPLP
jgi:hypothetical protein